MNNKEISLKNLTSPHELSRLDMRQCEKLCGEIRENIIRTVMKNGGHLSSNLGTVELAVPLRIRLYGTWVIRLTPTSF